MDDFSLFGSASFSAMTSDMRIFEWLLSYFSCFRDEFKLISFVGIELELRLLLYRELGLCSLLFPIR